MKNRRNTRRGRAKRWRMWVEGMWVNRNGSNPVMVAAKVDGRWYVSVYRSGSMHRYGYAHNRASAMKTAESLMRLK